MKTRKTGDLVYLPGYLPGYLHVSFGEKTPGIIEPKVDQMPMRALTGRVCERDDERPR